MWEWGIIYYGVKFVIYFMLVLGIFLVCKKWVGLKFLRIKMRRRLKARRDSMAGEKRLDVHLSNLLNATMGKNVKTNHFKIVSILISVSVFFIALQSLTLYSAILMSLVSGMLPYIALRVKLETGRRKGSYEGEQLMSEILSQYNIYNFNIYETLEAVVNQGKHIRVNRKLIYKLLLELRSLGNPEDIKRATEKFSFALDTNWSRMLGNNIRLAAEKGLNVSAPFEDILIQLREARVAVEERKRLNSESYRMIAILIPILYVGTIFTSTKYLSMPVATFVKNQFYTNQGFTMFFAIAVLFWTNILLLQFVSQQRFDF